MSAWHAATQFAYRGAAAAILFLLDPSPMPLAPEFNPRRLDFSGRTLMSWRIARAGISRQPAPKAASGQRPGERRVEPRSFFKKPVNGQSSALFPLRLRRGSQMTNQVTIDDLAARIVAEHKAVRAAMKSTLEHALACGDLLIEAKAKLAHGTWLPWLAEHCASLSERTAQVYISLARNRAAIRAAIEAKSADVCGFDDDDP